MTTPQQPRALKGGKSVNITESTNMRDTAQTAQTDPRKKMPNASVLGRLSGPPSPDSVGWHLPRYGSKNFYRYLLHAGVSLREFQRTPLWDRAVHAGLIVTDKWRGPADWQGDVELSPKGTNPYRLARRNPEQPHIAPQDR